jgi:BTB/POZ domain/Leucine rich repeat
MIVNCTFMQHPDCYACIIRGLSITRKGTEIIGVNGNHQETRTNFDVEKVQIYLSSIKFFPRGLGKIFPNLKSLIILKCGLREISRDDLKGLENLELLYLNGNHLISLPSDLFCDMKKLKKISFTGNKLERMSSKLLEPVKNVLQKADFSGNTKINFWFWSASPDSSLDKLMNQIDINCDLPFDEQQQRKAKIATEFIESLWASRRFSDFTIVVGLREIPVHKSVLGTQSPVFASIFENNVKERIEGKMEIEEFSASAVEDFLCFFYTGEIQNARNAMEIFELAAKYDIPKLQSIAEKMVLRQVDEQNAVHILELANLYKSENLKDKAFTEIKKMFPKTALQPELKDKPDYVKQLVEAKRDFEKKIKETKESAEKKMEKANEEFEMKMQKFNKIEKN